MSAYSSLKEMYKDTTQIIQGKDTAGKTVYLLKQFCFFAVCLLYLIEKCGFREVILSYVNIEITLPQIICDFLTIYLYKIIILYIAFYIIIKPLGLVIISEIKSRIKKDTFPIWLTFEDIVEIFFYSIVLLKLVQDILQCMKNENVMQGKNVFIYAFIIIGALYRFIEKIYIQNKNCWYYNTIRYTNFFDSDGKRIAQNDSVVYRNKIYELCKSEGIWYLQDFNKLTDIKLENAVADMEGKIQVYFLKMGIRKEEDEV